MAGMRRIKSVEDSIRDTDEPEHRLKKHLSGLDLTVFGVGVIIGTGIAFGAPIGRGRIVESQSAGAAEPCAGRFGGVSVPVIDTSSDGPGGYRACAA